MILFNDLDQKRPFSFNNMNYIICEIMKALRTKENITVAIILERTPMLLTLIKTLFEYEITFIPIDKDLPAEKIHYLLQDSNAEVVVTQLQSIDMSSYYESAVIENITIYNKKQELNCNEEHHKDIAYIIYTSGSTGQPKGIEITRYALLNFIEGITEIIDFSQEKRMACLTTVSFDTFLLESLMALYKGLTVVLGNEDEKCNPKLMAKLIQDKAVDMIQMTPSRLQMLLNYDKELSCLKNLKEIMIGGEPLPLSLLRTLQEKTTAKIYNMYGSTETTIWSTVSDLTNKEYIDIGRSIKNTEIYIVDENINIIENGQAGEICIAGQGLAKDYVRRADLTAEKFTYLPQKPNVRVYRTGDVGKYLPDGNLEYLGRIDNQVKIQGHRIELEQIESHLNQYNGMTVIQKEVLEVIVSNLDEIFSNGVSLDTDLNSIGIDSITFVKIIIVLEDKFDFEFEDEMLGIKAYSTIRSLSAYVEAKAIQI